MDNTNLNADEFERIQENIRALGKVADEATQNIAKILVERANNAAQPPLAQTFYHTQNTTAPALYRQQQQNIHSQNAPVQNMDVTELNHQQKHFQYNRLNRSTTNNFSFPCNYNQNVPVQNTPLTPLYHQPNLLFNPSQNVPLSNNPSTSQQQYQHCPFPSNYNQNVLVRSIPSTPLYEQQSLKKMPAQKKSAPDGVCGMHYCNSYFNSLKKQNNQRRQNMICSNCNSSNTPYWRRSHNGEPVCKWVFVNAYQRNKC